MSTLPCPQALTAALLLLLAACAPSPAALRMHEDPPFKVRGVDTDVDRVWAQADARCGTDTSCAARVHEAYRALRDDFVRGSRADRTEAAYVLRRHTYEGVTDWVSAGEATRQSRAARHAAFMHFLDEPLPPEVRCKTRIDRDDDKAATRCRTR